MKNFVIFMSVLISHLGFSQDNQLLINADYFRKNGQPKKSIKYYNKIIRKNKDHFLAINGRSLSYNLLKKDKKALKGYRKLIALEPDQGLIYLNRGMSYSNLKKYGLALDSYFMAEKKRNQT